MGPRRIRLYIPGAYLGEGVQEGKVATEVRKVIERSNEIDKVYDGIRYYRHVARQIGKKISRKKLNHRHVDSLYRFVQNALLDSNIAICGVDNLNIGFSSEIALVVSKILPILIFLPNHINPEELPSFPFHLPDVYIKQYVNLKTTANDIKDFIEETRSYLIEERD